MIKKPLNKVAMEGTYLTMIKIIYDKPTTNIILNGEKLKAFTLISGARQKCPFLFNVALKILATEVRGKKEIEGIQIGRKVVKLPLFANDMMHDI